MNRIAKYAAALFFVAATALQATAQEKIALKFTPKEKTKYTMTSEILQDINMEGMGDMGKAKNIIGFTYELETGSKDKDQNTNMVITYKKIKFVTESAMGSMGYDSEEALDTTNQFSVIFAKLFGALLDKKVNVKINPNGNVIEVTGMDKILEDIVNNSGIKQMPGGDAALEGLKQQFTNEQTKKSFDESFNVLPKEKVAIGDKWQVVTDKNIMNFDMAVTNNYTLKQIDKNFATVEMNSDLTMNQEEGMQLKGQQTGTMKIDRATGLTVDSNLTQTAKGNINSGGQEIPIEIVSTIKLTSAVSK